MQSKSIDACMVHYGISINDMLCIERLCLQYDLEVEWIKEDLLKAFHVQRIRNVQVDDKLAEKIIVQALDNMNSPARLGKQRKKRAINTPQLDLDLESGD